MCGLRSGGRRCRGSGLFGDVLRRGRSGRIRCGWGNIGRRRRRRRRCCGGRQIGGWRSIRRRRSARRRIPAAVLCGRRLRRLACAVTAEPTGRIVPMFVFRGGRRRRSLYRDLRRLRRSGRLLGSRCRRSGRLFGIRCRRSGGLLGNWSRRLRGGNGCRRHCRLSPRGRFHTRPDMRGDLVITFQARLVAGERRTMADGIGHGFCGAGMRGGRNEQNGGQCGQRCGRHLIRSAFAPAHPLLKIFDIQTGHVIA